MKQLSFFLAAIVLLTSCGGAGVESTDNITWGAAFNHVSQSFMYWLWVALAAIATAVYVWRITVSTDGWNQGRVLLLFLFLLLLMFAIMYLPSEIAANTTTEQAARGVYIGY
jgi:glucan phosphoethanolaminetransferase (alkaline phosphatase superfamily)